MQITKNISAALSTISDSMSKLKEELATVNQEIKNIDIKVLQLREMPISLDDWGFYLKAYIQRKGNAYLPTLHFDLLSTSRGNDPEHTRPFRRYEKEDGTPDTFLLPSNL